MERKASTHSTVGEHWVRVGPWSGRLVGISATQAVLQNADFDLQAWLDDLESHRIRAVMVWSFMAVRQTADGTEFDERWGRVVPGIGPWVRAPGAPTATDGLPQWDLTKFDEEVYWPRLRDLIEGTARRNMVLWITVFDGWAKKGGERPFHPFRTRNGGPLEHDADVVRLADYGTEVAGPYDPSWPWEKRNQWIQEQFADRLAREVAPHDHVVLEVFNEGEWYDPDLLWKHQRHFVEFFRSRVSAPIAVNADHMRSGDPWNDLSPDIVSWHSKGFDALTIYGRWLEGFRHEPIRPVVNSETVPAYAGDEEVSDDEVRALVWATLMAGGHVFVQDDTAFSFAGASSERRGEEMRRQVGIAGRFFARPELGDESLAPCAIPVEPPFCLARGEGRIVVYVPSGTGGVRLNLTARSTFHTRWFNPRDGTFLPLELRTAGGDGLSVEPPGAGDWVLDLEPWSPNAP